MENFISIDFETANGCPSSVCSVGLVVVKGGEIVDSYYSLIRPTPDYYAPFCQAVHGLGPDDTREAREFPEVWDEALQWMRRWFPFIDEGEVPLVAHNAPFDSGCLRAAYAAYDLFMPPYAWMDTLRASRRRWPEGRHNLDVIARYVGYDLTRHHHALADAEACAWIAREIL